MPQTPRRSTPWLWTGFVLAVVTPGLRAQSFQAAHTTVSILADGSGTISRQITVPPSIWDQAACENGRFQGAFPEAWRLKTHKEWRETHCETRWSLEFSNLGTLADQLATVSSPQLALRVDWEGTAVNLHARARWNWTPGSRLPMQHTVTLAIAGLDEACIVGKEAAVLDPDRGSVRWSFPEPTRSYSVEVQACGKLSGGRLGIRIAPIRRGPSHYPRFAKPRDPLRDYHFAIAAQRPSWRGQRNVWRAAKSMALSRQTAGTLAEPPTSATPPGDP